MNKHIITIALLTACILAPIANAQKISGEHKRKARLIADRAMEYLASRQHPDTLGFDDDPTLPAMPAISGLVLEGFMLDPTVDERNPTVATTVGYILSFVKPDGGIYDKDLPTYNTSICVSALTKIHSVEAMQAVINAQPFLKSLQYSESNSNNPNDPGFTEPIDINHPYYGGVGYGKHGRPDLSNLGFFLQALHDSGVSTTDIAYQRALVFLSRVQMSDEVNEMPYADGSNQGGFIYATVEDIESIDGEAGQSQAGTTIETTPDGNEITRLQAYGSMTYSGFKSLIYADLAPDDPRIRDAWAWIQNNYTLEENPGMGQEGYYYYLCAMSRALDAFGVDEINGHNWREEMIDKLFELQYTNGAVKVLNPRWMENNDTLITAYALIAVGHAAN